MKGMCNMQKMWKEIDLSSYPFWPAMQMVFDGQCRARKEDPWISQEAALAANRSSSTRVKRALLLWGIAALPDSTLSELKDRLTHLYPEIVEKFGGQSSGSFTHRNAKVLEEHGLIYVAGDRLCTISWSSCHTYRANEPRGVLQRKLF